jgi:uncharacterized membrane protein YedE/YeeE
MEHMSHLLMGLLTGALFGIVLHKVGAIRYSRVEGMLLLRDLKIMKFAFIAIATTSIIYGLADIFGVAEQTNLLPRLMPYMGIAHLVGGFLFGIAMASAGFCPGTCVARVGAGKFISLAGVIGLILGILIYANIQPWLVDVGILGTKLSQSISQDDVTDQFVDTQARLKNLLLFRDKMKTLLNRASKIEEILRIEEQLSRVQTQIDAIEGRLKYLKNTVDMSPIYVSFEEETIYGPLGYLGNGLWWVVKKLFVIK